ncbi:unnamed protein product [Closterium sp. Naga37s-1]|nr:unnamed protein product [Closterium sp. Naga37s-1]
MFKCLLITNKTGNILLERFHGLSADERGQWRAFLFQLGHDNLSIAVPEEQFVACYNNTYVVYTSIADIRIYLIGDDEYDELALSEILTMILDLLRVACKRTPTQAALLDRYGKVCLCLDEVIAQGRVEHMEVDRILRLSRLKPLDAS